MAEITRSSVGIFWGFLRGSELLELAIDQTPLSQAEQYGDFLTHPSSHYDVWKKWRRMGPGGLTARRLPTAIAWHEYENFPRGRVVYDMPAQTFIIYADPKLQVPATIRRIVDAFGLRMEQCVVKSDGHYRTTHL